MIEELDFSTLHTMAASLKAESETASEFTIDFIQCLMERYNLDTAVFEELELEEIPDEIIKILQDGKIPTKEDLLPLDSDTQNSLVMELIWLCGMQRVAAYCEDEEIEEGDSSTFDKILVMREVSPAHWVGSYLITALTLLMAKVPSEDFIDAITDNFEDSPENLLRITNILIETCGSIYYRYYEDSQYYNLKPPEEEEEE